MSGLREEKSVFKLKFIFKGMPVYPFSNYSSSCGTLTGRSHHASEKVVLINLCCVLGETEVPTEMRFRSSLVLLWKAEESPNPVFFPLKL